jgi:hypothetical protein
MLEEIQTEEEGGERMTDGKQCSHQRIARWIKSMTRKVLIASDRRILSLSFDGDDESYDDLT